MVEKKADPNAPSHRCGYTVYYRDREFWGTDVTCCRRPMNGGDLCLWHAQTEHKDPTALHELRGEYPERLDGSYLPHFSWDELPNLEECTLDSSYLECIQAKSTDLSSISMNSANLFGAELERSNLREIELRGANVSNANLQNVDLSNAHLRRAQVVNADLTGATARDLSAQRVKLHSSNLSQADFSEAYLRDAKLRGVTAEGAEFCSGEFENAEFQDSNLKSAKFSSSDMQECSFEDSKLSKSCFHESDLTHSHFQNCSAIDSDFSDSRLLNAEFKDASVGYARFDRSYLKHANMEGMNARNSSFKHANCKKADFTGAKMTEANLEGANLQRASLERVNPEDGVLIDADLRGSSLHESRISGCVISSVVLNEDSEIGQPGYPPNRKQERIRIYEKYQRALQENLLGKRIPQYRIKEMDCRRALARDTGQYKKWMALLLTGFASRYGERPKRVLEVSGVVVILFASAFFVHPEIGGIATDSLSNLLPETAALTVSKILGAIYMSLTSFMNSTNQLQTSPNSSFIAFLSLSEAVIGGLLLALFVFSLGRVATR